MAPLHSLYRAMTTSPVFPLALANNMGTLPYLPLGMVVAHLRVYQGGKLNDHYDLRRLQPGGSWVHTDYRYRGLRRDRGGRGLLGFESIESRPSNRNLFTRTLYSRSFPTASQPVTTSGIGVRRSDNARAVATAATPNSSAQLGT